jgi:ribonuclease G
LKKQVIVTVERGETRVAILEAEGDPSPPGKGDKPASRRRRGGRSGQSQTPAGWRVGELYIERRGSRSIVGNIYKGKVDNVLPGLEAAFVDVGLDKNGFLHVDDIVMPGVEIARRGRGGSKGAKIAQLLKPGQEVLVQVIKEGIGTKGPTLST